MYTHHKSIIKCCEDEGEKCVRKTERVWKRERDHAALDAWTTIMTFSSTFTPYYITVSGHISSRRNAHRHTHTHIRQKKRNKKKMRIQVIVAAAKLSTFVHLAWQRSYHYEPLFCATFIFVSNFFFDFADVVNFKMNWVSYFFLSCSQSMASYNM